MILGTAGHIDHGKTALVKALTGIDTDRLPEEKRRGITIELGFAPLVLEGVGMIGVVDVPGHDAFVRTMLAGSTGIDLAMLVIAADEGVMPQTREHLTILSLLGVNRGVVAITKSDLVDNDWIALVADDVRKLLRDTPFADVPIVACSAESGAGLDALRSALVTAAKLIPSRNPADFARLPIDRVFTVKGTGTVVAGTLWSGSFAADDEVRIVPGGNASPTARVRSIESHATAIHHAVPGNRTAVALAGIDRSAIASGSTLVRVGDLWFESRVLRADVTLLPGAKSLGIRTRVRFHLGTAEIGARVVAAGGKVEAGKLVPVRIVLDTSIVARSGDRFVIRAATPTATIGGGVITDPHPPALRAKAWPVPSADASTRLGWIVSESGISGVPLSDLPVRLGIVPNDVVGFVARNKNVVIAGVRAFDASLKDQLSARLLAAIASHHAAHPMETGLPLDRARQIFGTRSELFDQVMVELVAKNKFVVHANILARTGFAAAINSGDAERLEQLTERLEKAGTRPESVDELAGIFGPDTLRLLRVLEKQKKAVAVSGDRFFSPAAVAELLKALKEGVPAGSQVAASQLRDMLGVTRKYLIPFLEYCDRQRISVRTGDLRTFHWNSRPEPVREGPEL